MVVWQGTIIEDKDAEEAEFCDCVMEKFNLTRLPVLIGTVKTLPGAGGPGGRTDALFLIHQGDVSGFAMTRLKYADLKWFGDVVGDGIYPPELMTAYPSAW